MTAEAIPQTGRKISVGDSSYTSPLTQDVHRQKGYEAPCSNDLTRTGKNYIGTLALIPAGQRMSVLEEIAYLVQRERELRAENKNPREALADSLFDRFIRGNPYLWEWTHVAFRAPEGAEDFTKYVETDPQGRVYHRGDYLIGNKVVAEGIMIPEGNGRKIVEWNEALRMPAVTSGESEPQHTTHFRFSPNQKEVAIELSGHWYLDEHDDCLDFDAYYKRSHASSGDAFRLFQGSLDEVPLPTVELFVKDRESFEKGRREGLTEGRRAATVEIMQDMATLPVEEVLRKYRQ